MLLEFFIFCFLWNFDRLLDVGIHYSTRRGIFSCFSFSWSDRCVWIEVDNCLSTEWFWMIFFLLFYFWLFGWIFCCAWIGGFGLRMGVFYCVGAISAPIFKRIWLWEDFCMSLFRLYSDHFETFPAETERGLRTILVANLFYSWLEFCAYLISSVIDSCFSLCLGFGSRNITVNFKLDEVDGGRVKWIFRWITRQSKICLYREIIFRHLVIKYWKLIYFSLFLKINLIFSYFIVEMEKPIVFLLLQSLLIGMDFKFVIMM